MPYVTNQGIRTYYETEGEGPPLVLLYGIFASVDIWRHLGFVKLLRDDYQLILIDTRGHGRSDKPHGPEAYKVSSLVADVVAVLDDLSISKAHLMGYSMGADIAFWAAARYAPERVSTLILGGGHPDTEEREPGWIGKMLIEYWKLRQGTEVVLGFFETYFGQWWTPQRRAIFQANDLEALIALLAAEEGIFLPGSVDWMQNVRVPCLIYVGDDDNYAAAKGASEKIADATLVSFPGDHCEVGCNSGLVVPHIRKFLAEVG